MLQKYWNKECPYILPHNIFLTGILVERAPDCNKKMQQ